MVGAERHRHIVALDFGTTFTGIAHVSSTKKKLDDIVVINNWPGPSKEYTEVWKTPSKIAYRTENLSIGNENISAAGPEVIWGYDVEPGMTCYSWMKLHLDADARITAHDDTTLLGLASGQRDGIMQLPPGKSAQTVVTDYLREIYKYTMQELERVWGEGMMRTLPIDFVFTVPATWSDRAKNVTKRAAIEAGFATRKGDMWSVITEPEAAAIATLSSLVGIGSENQLHAGDGILVCDCGGGTVDINTYRVQATFPKLEFEELAVGQGGKAGSTYVDRQFQQWLSDTFGSEYDNLPYHKRGPGSALMKKFEEVKRQFAGQRTMQRVFRMTLPLRNPPDSFYYDKSDFEIKLPREILESFFQPAIMIIKRLLREQLTKANEAMASGSKINFVVLVGGFGNSPYLYDVLKAWCAQQGGIKLLCPPHPQAAIVKGAALQALGSIKPSRRRCRRHYGFSLNNFFIQGLYPEHRAYINDWNGQKYCRGNMFWGIARGDFVTEQTMITTEVETVWYEGTNKEHSMILYNSSSDVAPSYVEEFGVEPTAQLRYNFNKVNIKSLFPSKMINNKKAYLITYKVQVHLGSEQGMLVFKVICAGKEIGKATIDFNVHDI